MPSRPSRKTPKRKPKQTLRRKNVREMRRGKAAVSKDAIAQHGRLVDRSTGNVGQFALSDGVFDLDNALLAAQELTPAESQYWEIRAIFAHRRQDSPVRGALIRPIRQVGLFLFRPRGLSPQITEDIISLPIQEADDHLRQAREYSGRLIKERSVIFVVDDPAEQSGVQTVTRSTLIRYLMNMWRKPPVNSNGSIQLWYDHIDIQLTRDDLLHEVSRDRLFGHVNHIMELMQQGFKFDPWAGDQPSEGKLRRVNDRGIGPWVRDRR